MMKFYLKFPIEGKIYIEEPIGFDASTFEIKQESGRYARDILFSETELIYCELLDHQFELLSYYFDRFGFESKVIQGFEIEDTVFETDLDFSKADTDGANYISMPLILDGNLQRLKRNRDVNVDLFSNKNLFDEEITPLTTQKILLKAKPITSLSVWEKINNLEINLPFGSTTANQFVKLVNYDLKDSLVPFQSVVNGTSASENFLYVRALNNLSNVTIKLEQSFFANVNYSGQGNVTRFFELRVAWGQDWATRQSQTLFSTSLNNFGGGTRTYTNNSTFNINIGFLPRNTKVWIYYSSSPAGSVGNTGRFQMVLGGSKMTITGASTAYNTVIPMVRLYDAIKQVCVSSAKIGINAPIYEFGGELYSQFIASGNMVRQKLNKPFNLSLKAIEEGIIETNVDYEVGSKVFFGHHTEFYRPVEIMSLAQNQFEGYSKGFSERAMINRFNFGYKNFLSKKENSKENTEDSVHGESEWKLQNDNVENSKDISVGFIRDAFLIADMQEKAIREASTTADNDDDKIIILDVFEQLTGTYTQFTENDFLQHAYDPETTRLTLRNTGTFSWSMLGITVGVPFTILSGANAGTYTVYEVNNTSIVLNRFFANPNTNGEFQTRFTYYIGNATLAGVARTNQGITTSNILNGENYPNLRFSAKRNIINYWNEFLANGNYFANKDILNTLYKNNPNATITYNGITTLEGENFIPNKKMLSPTLFKEMVYLIEFSTFVEMMNLISTERGYFRGIDSNQLPIKFFVVEMTYNIATRECIITGEEKYDPSTINIDNTSRGMININNEYFVHELKYSVDGEKIKLTDMHGYLIYKPIFWHRISVNGRIAETKNQLLEWLQLL